MLTLSSFGLPAVSLRGCRIGRTSRSPEGRGTGMSRVTLVSAPRSVAGRTGNTSGSCLLAPTARITDGGSRPVDVIVRLLLQIILRQEIQGLLNLFSGRLPFYWLCIVLCQGSAQEYHHINLLSSLYLLLPM
jgi:hypothetical protein